MAETRIRLLDPGTIGANTDDIRFIIDDVNVDESLQLTFSQICDAGAVSSSAIVAGLATASPRDDQLWHTIGYLSPGDSGGDLLRYDISSSALIDNGWVFNGPGSVGRYIAIDRTVANVRKFSAAGDGVADDTAACQAAISTGGDVYFPAGTYRTTAPLAVNAAGAHIRGDGPGKTIVNATNATAAFQWQGNYTHLENMTISSSGCDTIDFTGACALSTFEHLRLVTSTGKSAIKVATGSWTNVRMEDCELTGAAPGHNTALIRVTTSGVFVGNSIQNCSLNMGAGTAQPAIYIQHQGGAVAHSTLRFADLLFSECNGGAIHLFGVKSSELEGIGIRALTGTITGSQIFLGQQATNSRRSEGIVLNGYRRDSGTLGGGIFDIAMDTTRDITLLNFADSASSTCAISIDASSGNVTLGHCSNFTVTPTAQTAFTAKLGTLSRILTGTGSPLNVVSAPVGRLYLNESGGAGTTLWIKESGGTGSTGWVAK